MEPQNDDHGKHGWVRCGVVVALALVMSYEAAICGAQLSPDYYGNSCPQVFDVVRPLVQQAVAQEPRMAASLVRLHFHDCIVSGCDASILLDDTATFTGEKNAGPNRDSLRGFDVIDSIKSALEQQCQGTVSCADILAIASRDSIALTGGPSWVPLLGRTDGTTASQNAANQLIPAPTDTLSTIFAKFQVVGLDSQDVVTLSGAHTIGRARCVTFSGRLFNFTGSTGGVDPSMDTIYANSLQQVCGAGSNANTLVNLDPTTPNAFDNSYFVNLQNAQGLLQSDQHLYAPFQAPASTVLVDLYAFNQDAFFARFGDAMIRMGNISPNFGGQIRKKCHMINQ